MTRPDQNVASACPLPPDAFHEAAIPLVEMNLAATVLYRVHRRSRDPIHYNRRSVTGTVFRFDAPTDEYGVLYASPSFDVCMAETIMRERFQGVDARVPHLIEEADLTTRCIATLGFEDSRSLKLADLTQPLWQHGFDGRVLTVGAYAVPNLWSAAIHENRQDFDGIYFRSRYANDISVAIFSDRATLVRRGESIPLIQHPDLPEFLDRYGIGIAPESGSGWRKPVTGRVKA